MRYRFETSRDMTRQFLFSLCREQIANNPYSLPRGSPIFTTWNRTWVIMSVFSSYRQPRIRCIKRAVWIASSARCGSFSTASVASSSLASSSRFSARRSSMWLFQNDEYRSFSSSRRVIISFDRLLLTVGAPDRRALMRSLASDLRLAVSNDRSVVAAI